MEISLLTVVNVEINSSLTNSKSNRDLVVAGLNTLQISQQINSLILPPREKIICLTMSKKTEQ